MPSRFHPINSSGFSESGWKIEGGELCSIALGVRESMNGTDLVTNVQYGDFELVWEWKMLAPGGGSKNASSPPMFAYLRESVFICGPLFCDFAVSGNDWHL